ncbi:hypothetical protein [Actinoplanes sp. NPDC026619]|uniref:hypothetical protein n=1 Tax=Actinoplanes sp. NPDC026619 TaxID=3155798 RepID=UPI00340DD98F
MVQPAKADNQGRPTIKRYLHGELAKVDEGYLLDVIVELKDGVVHHHLGGSEPRVREVANRYEVGPSGELTVWSIRLDRSAQEPPKIRRVITYGPHAWSTVEGPALPLGVRKPEAAAMVDPGGWQDPY